MGNRLSKIYTKTGDNGTSGLASGKRFIKSHILFEAMGDIDELNSQIGLIKSVYVSTFPDRKPLDNLADDCQNNTIDFVHTFSVLQHLLFNLGGEIATTGSDYKYQGIEDKYVTWLEEQMDTMNATLLPLKDFILPSGTPLMCQLHIARSICRRAERHSVKLSQEMEDSISDVGLCFVNRLSDWLFVACRYLTPKEQIGEVLWDKEVLK